MARFDRADELNPQPEGLGLPTGVHHDAGPFPTSLCDTDRRIKWNFHWALEVQAALAGILDANANLGATDSHDAQDRRLVDRGPIVSPPLIRYDLDTVVEASGYVSPAVPDHALETAAVMRSQQDRRANGDRLSGAKAKATPRAVVQVHELGLSAFACVRPLQQSRAVGSVSRQETPLGRIRPSVRRCSTVSPQQTRERGLEQSGHIRSSYRL